MSGCAKSSRNFITGIDDFGFPIQVNFNKQGPTANTVSGGCCSLFIRACLIFFVVFKCYGIS